jgi:hypothetical protein
MEQGEVFVEGKLIDEKTARRRKLDQLDAKERRQLDKWILRLENNTGYEEILAEMNRIGPRLRPALEAIPTDSLLGSAGPAVQMALFRLQH